MNPKARTIHARATEIDKKVQTTHMHMTGKMTRRASVRHLLSPCSNPICDTQHLQAARRPNNVSVLPSVPRSWCDLPSNPLLHLSCVRHGRCRRYKNQVGCLRAIRPQVRLSRTPPEDGRLDVVCVRYRKPRSQAQDSFSPSFSTCGTHFWPIHAPMSLCSHIYPSTT